MQLKTRLVVLLSVGPGALKNNVGDGKGVAWELLHPEEPSPAPHLGFGSRRTVRSLLVWLFFQSAQSETEIFKHKACIP